MGLHPDFPADPYAILDPAVRWYPGEEMLGEMGYAMLLPPLVHKVRQGVKAWRDSGYAGASATTRALLLHWFHTEHLMPQADGTVEPFRWYFAQQEAVESALWLYEVERARDPYALMRYDSSGRVSANMFPEDWTRYVLKLATGAGKTKVMSLLMAWSYFHKLYETDSDLSTNFLLIAPNIIVLDRLRADFDGARIFFEDPILPENGHEGRNWQDDFQLTVHIQDEIGFVGPQGNLFLTNIHRVYEGADAPSFEDSDTTGYFLGAKPVAKTTESAVDLGVIIRDVPDLVVLNDEAHHLHDEKSAWFKAIEDISLRLRQKGAAAFRAVRSLGNPEAQQRRDLRPDDCRLSAGRGDPAGRGEDAGAAGSGLAREADGKEEREIHRAVRRLSASRLSRMEQGLRRACAHRARNRSCS